MNEYFPRPQLWPSPSPDPAVIWRTLGRAALALFLTAAVVLYAAWLVIVALVAAAT